MCSATIGCSQITRAKTTLFEASDKYQEGKKNLCRRFTGTHYHQDLKEGNLKEQMTWIAQAINFTI